MSNIFDDLRDNCHDVTAVTMGKQASWAPSGGGDTKTCDVLFNDPDMIRQLGEIEYNPKNTVISWRKPFFDGLKDSVDAGTTEHIVVETVSYYVHTAKNIFDGNTTVAVVQQV